MANGPVALVRRFRMVIAPRSLAKGSVCSSRLSGERVWRYLLGQVWLVRRQKTSYIDRSRRHTHPHRLLNPTAVVLTQPHIDPHATQRADTQFETLGFECIDGLGVCETLR